jgi:RimJ/RimL family protein N-acetyltransferase
VELQKDNLRIRSATSCDAKMLCRWWNDGKVMAHAGFPKGLGTTEEDVIRRIEQDSDGGRRLILELHGIAIGEMNYRAKGNRTAEMGIKICVKDQQNRGYGSAYLRMLIDHLLSNMDFDRIVLDTNVNNKRAQHVYEKLGFRRLRVRTNAWRNQEGELQSSVDYELKKADFIKD